MYWDVRVSIKKKCHKAGFLDFYICLSIKSNQEAEKLPNNYIRYSSALSLFH